MDEPYNSGILEVGEDHQVYWECHGNPDGRSAIYFHGGAGQWVVSKNSGNVRSRRVSGRDVRLARLRPEPTTLERRRCRPGR